MHTTLKETKHHDNYIIELFRTILPYKWSIVTITTIAILLAKFYLYFIPSTYESYAVINVRVNNNVKTEDVIRDTLAKTNTNGIKQEMAILKTFKTNRQALNDVNFKVRYFKKENYKMVELYGDTPIELTNINSTSYNYINHEIKLTPKKDGFTLTSKLLGVSKLYPFNQEIETPYFKGTVTKKRDLKDSIYLKVNGNKRYIYESIIKNSLSVSQINPNANLIKITFQDTIPKRANEYIDALVKAYIAQSIKKKESTNNKILTFLERQLEATQIKLEKSENQLEQYKSANSVAPSIKTKDAYEKLSAIDLELSELELKEKLVRNLIIFIKNNKNLDAVAPTLLEFNAQTTLKLIDDFQNLQKKKEELKSEYTERYPELIKVRKSIERTKKKIILNVNNINSTLLTRKRTLIKQKKSYEKTLKELPFKEKKLISLQRKYRVNSKMYTYLLEKKSENELIKVASESDYEAIDSAYNSGVPIKPKRTIVVMVAGVLGFIFAILLALLRSLFVDKIADTKEVSLLTQLPIFGIIPIFKNPMLSGDIIKEAFQKLATNLEFSKKEHEGNIVLITSNRESEGKTTITSNLAGVFQNSHYNIIVVDFNMKSPSLHTLFGIEHQYSGVSTYLSKRDNIGNIIFSTNYPNIDIITAGPTPPNPLELLLSPRLKELFEALKKRYDYIFIDTASYSDSLDTLYLMQYADTNLVVLKEGFTKKSTITNLEKIIKEKNLKNIGLVLQTNPKDDKKGLDRLLINNISTNNQTNLTQPKPIQLTM